MFNIFFIVSRIKGWYWLIFKNKGWHWKKMDNIKPYKDEQYHLFLFHITNGTPINFGVTVPFNFGVTKLWVHFLLRENDCLTNI